MQHTSEFQLNTIMDCFNMSSLSFTNKTFSLKPLSLKRLGGLALGLGSFSLSMVMGYTAHAQSAEVNIQFIPPSITNYDIDGLADRGAPEGRQAAGTRGPCLAQSNDAETSTSVSPKLTVLMPTVPVSYGEQTVHTPMGTTSEAYPTFFFYMPHTQQVVDAIQFTLLDAEDYIIASLDVPVPEHAGVLSVSWPQEQLPLENATDYRWLLQVDCHNPMQPSEQFTTDLVVEGFIRRFAGPNGLASPSAHAAVAPRAVVPDQPREPRKPRPFSLIPDETKI